MMVRRVAPADASAARELVLQAKEPLVLTGMIERWPARRWTPRTLARQYPDARVCARLHPRGAGVVWESDCVQQSCGLAEFCEWLELADGSRRPADHEVELEEGLARFVGGGFVGYADYQDMAALLPPEALGALDWRDVVGVERDGAESTLWLGSEGAHTPTHYDAYGVNLVAQLHGTKRWRLHPPDAPLEASRLPYEESSIFADGAADGDDAHSRGCREVVLAPGEVLLVPRHWWHFVTTLSSSALSVNTWLDLPTDAADRLREALVRVVATAVLRDAAACHGGSDGGGASDGAGGDGSDGGTVARAAAASTGQRERERHAPAEPPPWLNPTEVFWSHGDNMAALRTALYEAHPECAARVVTVRDLVNAVCTGPALDAAVTELCRRQARPQQQGRSDGRLRDEECDGGGSKRRRAL